MPINTPNPLEQEVAETQTKPVVEIEAPKEDPQDFATRIMGEIKDLVPARYEEDTWRGMNAIGFLSDKCIEILDEFHPDPTLANILMKTLHDAILKFYGRYEPPHRRKEYKTKANSLFTKIREVLMRHMVKRNHEATRERAQAETNSPGEIEEAREETTTAIQQSVRDTVEASIATDKAEKLRLRKLANVGREQI